MKEAIKTIRDIPEPISLVATRKEWAQAMIGVIVVGAIVGIILATIIAMYTTV